jgi:large subunit ribosomal protein L25
MEERVLELIDLKVETRDDTGKGAARKLRQNGAFPAVVYGSKKDPMMLTVSTPEFTKIVRINGTSGLFLNLIIDGDTKKSKSVMLKDIQMDIFKNNYYHADFFEIDMDTKVSINVPVEATGKSVGVEAGGMLQIIRRELEVLCKPANAPESIIVDITDLDVGDVVHVEDIDLGEDVEIPHEVNFTVLTIVPPTVEEEPVEDEDELLGDEEETEEEATAETESASDSE